MDGLEFRLLGPIEARAGGAALELGGPRQRAVLALLVLEANRAVSTDRLIDGVWGGQAPATVGATLQSYVSRLRRAVGAETLLSVPSGYELRADPDRIDLFRFRRLAEAGRRHLAAGDARRAAATLQDALDLWRGEPFGDLAYEDWASREAERLAELRLAALEDRLEAELALGRHADLVGELELLVFRHPLRERLRAQLMLALYRAGRQAEALEAYQDARRALVEGLGLDPGRSLQQLEQAILRQDPALDLPPAAAEPDRGPALVGRDAELSRLRDALDAALAGRGSLVVVTGEPGIGKTRLAEQLALDAAHAGALPLWGRCWEAGGAPPYWPWAQVLRFYLGGVDADELRARLGARLPRLAAALPSLREVYAELGAEYAPPEDRFVVFSAAAEFFGGEARNRPLVVLLDDLHAADEPSLLLLRFLAGELPAWPLLLVGLARDGAAPAGTKELLADATARAHVRIDVGGLPRPAVSALVEQLTGRLPAQELVDSIRADTGGNPLFVAEVARVLADDEAPARVRLPASLRDVIGRRLRGLSDGCREALVYASVVGREFDLPTLARVAGVESGDLLDPLDEAMAARVLADVPDGLGRFRFAHALMRESLYLDLTPTARMRLHRRVGEALERVYAGVIDAHLGELAHHFFEAAPAGDAAKAAEYAERAARRALRALAFEEASRLFRLALRALELAGDAQPARIADDLLGLGEAQARAGDLEQARSTFLRVAELARDAGLVDRLAQAALGVSGRFAWSRQGADPELVPLLEEALATLPDGDSPLRARLLARLAGALRDQPAREPRASLSAEAVDVARRVGDPATLSYALEARWHAIWWTENAAERLEISNELAALASRSRDRERAFEAHQTRAVCLHELGRPHEADVEIALARRAAAELGQPAQQSITTSNLAVRALAEGRFAEAEALVERAFLIGAIADPDATVGHVMQLFVLRREQGRLGELEPQLAAAAAEHPNRWPLRCLLAHLYAALGRAAEARDALGALGGGDLARLPRDNEWLFGLSVLPEVCGAAGDTGRAAALYELLEPFAGRLACNLHDADTGAVHRPLGLLAALLGRREQAIAHLEAAIEHNDAVRYRPWAAWSRAALASLLLEAGDVRGRPLLDGAIATAHELGMSELLRAASA